MSFKIKVSKPTKVFLPWRAQLWCYTALSCPKVLVLSIALTVLQMLQIWGIWGEASSCCLTNICLECMHDVKHIHVRFEFDSNVFIPFCADFSQCFCINEGFHQPWLVHFTSSPAVMWESAWEAWCSQPWFLVCGVFFDLCETYLTYTTELSLEL